MVLAAGVGSRLRPLTELRPKCLVEVGGVSLLRHLLGEFRPYVSKMVVVAGYRAAMVEEAVASVHFGIPIDIVRNVDFGFTNSMYSAFANAFAKDSAGASRPSSSST